MDHVGESSRRVRNDSRVLTVVLDNPPANMLSAAMMRELRDLLNGPHDDVSVRVIVFQSADPEFFLASVDMRIAEHMDILEDCAVSAPQGVNGFHRRNDSPPASTIVKLAGKARGGAEFVASSSHEMLWRSGTQRALRYPRTP